MASVEEKVRKVLADYGVEDNFPDDIEQIVDGVLAKAAEGDDPDLPEIGQHDVTVTISFYARGEAAKGHDVVDAFTDLLRERLHKDTDDVADWIANNSKSPVKLIGTLDWELDDYHVDRV